MAAARLHLRDFKNWVVGRFPLKLGCGGPIRGPEGAMN